MIKIPNSKHEKGSKAMKKLLISIGVMASILTNMSPAQAHGWERHGGYGGHGGYHGGGWGVPLITGAIVGAGLYAASRPYYPPAYSDTTIIYNQPSGYYNTMPAPGSAPYSMGYYCQTSQQFYPVVPTCQTPWLQIPRP
jgi:hypothetical protein